VVAKKSKEKQRAALRLNGEAKSFLERAEAAEAKLKMFEALGIRGRGGEFYQGRYKAELKKRWLANKWSPQQVKLVRNLDRRPGLRGEAFVHELARLAVLTKERCFKDAIDALVKHGIVDGHLNFTLRWRHPDEAESEAEWKRAMLTIIRFYIKAGMTDRRACAEAAAIVGFRAKTFEAAIRFLQIELSKASSEKML
jgi:hypothetical protein